MKLTKTILDIPNGILTANIDINGVIVPVNITESELYAAALLDERASYNNVDIANVAKTIIGAVEVTL